MGRPQPFKLERFFAKYEFTAPYILCGSATESFSVQELWDFEPQAAAAFPKLWLGYTEPPGHPELRKVIASTYTGIEAQDVLVHAGAEEAIYNFMHALLDSRDHVFVQTPCYQAALELPQSIGCEVTAWQAREEHGWRFDLKDLEQGLRPNTKAVIINSPHNPTGSLMDREGFLRLVEWVRAHRLLLFVDEVFRGLEHDPADRLPSACEAYEHAVSLGVMSKTYGLAGLRIGWIATKDRSVYEKMALFKDYTTICNSAPSEFLATLALRHREKILTRNMDIVRKNLVLMNAFFARHRDRFVWTPPKAGVIAFPRLKIDPDADAFCLDLVEKKGVLLMPSSIFDWGRQHFRISFGLRNMAAALERFEEYLNESAIK